MIQIITRARRSSMTLFITAMIAATAAGAIACSSSSGGKATPTAPANAATTPRTAGTAGPPPTPVPQPKTPASLPTITGDPFNYPLTKVEGGAGNFTMSVPAAWEHVTEPGIDRFVIRDGPYQAGTVTVECGEPKSPYADVPYTSAALAQAEVTGIADRRKAGTAGSVSEINVNGHVGATYRDSRTVGLGVGTNGNSVFFAEPDCAWVIRFVYINTFQPGEYQSLFGKIVSTFEPGSKGR